MPFAAILLIGCLALLAEPPAPARPASSDREVSFDALFARAKRVVEEQLEIRLEASLEQVETMDEWRTEGPELDFVPFVFFRRADRKVVMDPSRFRSFLLTRTKSAKDAEDLGVILFVHELFHAYQADEIRRLDGGEFPGRWVRFACEGHAAAFTEATARVLGMSDDVLNSLRRGKVRYTGRLEQDRRAVRDEFYYRLSVQFVRDRCPKAAAFPILFASPAAYPEMLFCNLQRMRPSEQSSRELGALEKSIGAASARPVTKLDYFEAAILLCPPVFADQSLCETYCGGALLACQASDGSAADVLLLHFLDGQNETFAARLREYAFLCRRDEGRACFDLPDGVFLIDNFPDQGRRLYCFPRGGESLFVAVEKSDSGVKFARQCLFLFRKEEKP